MRGVDDSELLERVGGSQELLVEVIDLFLEEGPQLLGRIQQALAQGDATGVQSGAHSLKGSAGNFGPSSVATLAREMEIHASTGSLDAVAGDVSALEVELKQLSDELVALRNRAAAGSVM